MARFSADILKKRIKEYWREYRLTEKEENVLVACSGGPDSLALLDLLQQLQDALNIKVYAAHYEHGIRGDDSVADAEFVSKFCRSAGIRCFVEHGDIPALAKEIGQSIETCAREQRYSFLRNCLLRMGGGVIATAHHQDDQAETVLMHLLRGTGVNGLSGMLPRRNDVIRPLLCVAKSDLVEYCLVRRLKYRTDETNLIADCRRNKIRLELVPLLQAEYNPSLVKALCNLAAASAGDEAYLQQQTKAVAEKLLCVNKGVVSCNIAELLKQPLAIQRRLVQIMAARLDSGLSFQHVQTVLSLCQRGVAGSCLSLPDYLDVRINYEFLCFSKKNILFSENSATIYSKRIDNELWLEENSSVILPSGDVIRFEFFDQKAFKKLTGFDRNKIYLDCDRCQLPLLVRYRQAGDKIAIKGGHKKLKDYFVDAKVDRRIRDKVPLVCSGVSGEILWVVGYRQTITGLADATTSRYAVLTLIEKKEN